MKMRLCWNKAIKTKKAQQTEAIIKDLNLSPNGGQQEKQ